LQTKEEPNENRLQDEILPHIVFQQSAFSFDDKSSPVGNPIEAGCAQRG
jgi:hypothetical protein